MKKMIVLVATLLMATSAYASKARLLALGEDQDGSPVVNDARNIFMNSAYIHNFSDMAFFEWGNSGNAVNLDVNDDTMAQGGFLKKAGNMVYGVNLGNQSNTIQLLRMSAYGAGAGEFLGATDNVVDFFFGMEHGATKWGANFVYSKGKDESLKQKDTSMGMRLGMIRGPLELLVNISLANETTDSNMATGGLEQKYDGKLGYHLGASYLVHGLRPFISYKKGKWDVKSGATTTKGSFSELFTGVGHTKSISTSSRVYTKFAYESTKVDLKYAANPVKINRTDVPATIGFETDATSWLTLRGSVRHNITGKRDIKNIAANTSLNAASKSAYNGKFNNGLATDFKGTNTNATSVSAGATLNFGDLQIDGMIGTNGGNGTVSTTGNNGALDLDRLLSRVAVNYSF